MCLSFRESTTDVIIHPRHGIWRNDADAGTDDPAVMDDLPRRRSFTDDDDVSVPAS
jgi:hypothetical protein